MTDKLRAAYLIHRVGPDGPQREANIAATREWIRFFVDVLPGVAINAPWLAYVMSLDEATYRERGMADGNTLALADVNGIGIVCGPAHSEGTIADRLHLLNAGRGVLDVTGFGLVHQPSLTDGVREFIQGGVRDLWLWASRDREHGAKRGPLLVVNYDHREPTWRAEAP